jgi:flagellar hook-associated protein 3 FlgL
MRVDPNFVSNMTGSLDQTQATQQRLSNELSSGVRVNALSDDPVAAGENVLLLNQMQRDDSFTQSSSLVQGQLQVGDSALGSVVSQLTQHFAGDQRQQRHYECEPVAGGFKPACGYSR